MAQTAQLRRFEVIENEAQRVFTLQRQAYLRHPYPSLDERRENLAKLERILLDNMGAITEAINADFGHRAFEESMMAELFTSVDTSGLLRDLPITDYLDGRLPGSTALGKMGTEPVGNFPTALVSAQPRQKSNAVSGPVKDPKDGKDYSSVESMAAEKASLAWTGGEVGFIYGHESGKFGGDTFSSYIIGGVGNDHMQINVGASYDETHYSHSHH